MINNANTINNTSQNKKKLRKKIIKKLYFLGGTISLTIGIIGFMPLNLFSNESMEDKCGNICKNCEAYLDGKCEGCGNF